MRPVRLNTVERVRRQSRRCGRRKKKGGQTEVIKIKTCDEYLCIGITVIYPLSHPWTSLHLLEYFRIPRSPPFAAKDAETKIFTSLVPRLHYLICYRYREIYAMFCALTFGDHHGKGMWNTPG